MVGTANHTPYALSVILPCYNPPAGWQNRIVEQFRALEKLIEAPLQLIVVNDGAAAVTQVHADFLQKAIPSLIYIHYTQNRGKGYALRQGVAAATGQVILYTDIDFPYTLESLQEVYDAIVRDGHDVAIGVKNEAYYSHVPPFRKAISKSLKGMTRILLSLPVTDTQCGIKAFRKEVRQIFLGTRIDRYLFDLEFVRAAFRQKPAIKIKAIPVALHPGVAFRKMNPRILFSEVFNFISLLLK